VTRPRPRGLPPEDELVARLTSVLGTRRRDVLLGIGDDAAVVKPGEGPLAVTTDVLVEDVDFRSDADPRRLGRKALTVNVSDLAAMGATPLYAVVSLALPREADPAWFEAFAQGVRSAANDYGVAVVGGDLSAASVVFVSVCAIGRASEKGALTRTGARPRDAIYVSGTLGAASAGLALLEAGYRLHDDGVSGPRGRRVAAARAAELARLVRHQVDPRAMVELGRMLADGGLASSAIDVSDGLARDLHRLCRASGAAAVIDASQLPVDSGLALLPELTGFDPRSAALYGGEDFGLLFTVPKRHLAAVDRLSSRFALRRIGEMTAGSTVTLAGDGRSALLPEAGFDHFSGESRPAAASPKTRRTRA
jgi:thiamine-monophosphate kinase